MALTRLLAAYLDETREQADAAQAVEAALARVQSGEAQWLSFDDVKAGSSASRHVMVTSRLPWPSPSPAKGWEYAVSR